MSEKMVTPLAQMILILPIQGLILACDGHGEVSLDKGRFLPKYLFVNEESSVLALGYYPFLKPLKQMTFEIIVANGEFDLNEQFFHLSQ